MLKNIDSIPRTFKVEITHYYADRSATKEFTLQIEPGRIKTAMMDTTDFYLGDNGVAIIRKAMDDGDWGIDYQVIPQ